MATTVPPPPPLSASPSPPRPAKRDWRLVGFAIVWALFCLAMDYATGPGVQFGALYAIPVVVTAWEAQLGLALAIALLLPAAEFMLDLSWGSFADPGEELFTSVIRVVALVVVALLVHRFSRMRARPERSLLLAPEGTRRCGQCGRIEDAAGEWWVVDDVLVAALSAHLRPTRCPTCETALH